MAYKTICRKLLHLCDILSLDMLSHPVWCKMLPYMTSLRKVFSFCLDIFRAYWDCVFNCQAVQLEALSFDGLE